MESSSRQLRQPPGKTRSLNRSAIYWALPLCVWLIYSWAPRNTNDYGRRQDFAWTNLDEKFSPMRITECTASMPSYYAPCFGRKLAHATVAEELIYPPFEMSAPIFAPSRPLDAEKWWSTTWLIWERAYKLGDRLRYNEKHGQIYVFENVTLSARTPFDRWDMQACMSSFTPTSFVEPTNELLTHESVLLANTPDSWSFQHFLDRAMRVVAQSHEFPAEYVAIGESGDRSVTELWSSLGYSPDHVLHNTTDFATRRLVWSCRAPLASPWLTRKEVSMLHPQTLEPVPLTSRKVVLYMTRNNGLARNGGRQIVNEDLLLAEIRAHLGKRGQKEELQVFSHKDFDSTASLMKFVHENVKAVIGPHGSALHNSMWAAHDTLVVEFQPSTRPDLAFYESTKLRDHQYAVLMLDSVDEYHNMEADIPAVIEILEDRLGQEMREADKIQLAYDWEAEELEVR